VIKEHDILKSEILKIKTLHIQSLLFEKNIIIKNMTQYTKDRTKVLDKEKWQIANLYFNEVIKAVYGSI
jgi:hypothetical protein